MAASPIGLMNHFTMSTPDVDACKRFWIDFMGASWYSESYRLVQFLIGGILVDCFPPADVSKIEELPQPGGESQAFRFSIAPEVLGDWVARAEEFQVRSRLVVHAELQRAILLFFAPGDYHVAMEARYVSREALEGAVSAYRARVERLEGTRDAVAAPSAR